MLKAGDLIQLTDPKGRKHLLTLREGATFHTHRGALNHDDIIGGPDGNVVRSIGGTPYVIFRPLLADYTLAMKRGAAVVYPKDAAQIVAFADVFPGARVLEAGAGSGALSCWLLRAIGQAGQLVSYERRPDFAEVAQRNVAEFFGAPPVNWRLVTGSLVVEPGGSGGMGSPQKEAAQEGFDRVILDMLAPWDCADTAAAALVPGGLVCCYVATTTQLSRTVETLREHGSFDEPSAWESMVRGWHVEGLAVRPEHRMVGHTGFLVTARRLAPGVVPAPRRRRPAKSEEI
ncbi:MAG TPA: tRNA (adenine-N1)-methyltransferase [Streptosporangiaceae bacterium]|nr:tRNA (adenine-N1)-methyltransferase [Streptosporangiaceae bacterium]